MIRGTNSNGLVLIGVMIYLALFALISGITFYHAINSTQLSAKTIHSRRAHLNIVSKSFEKSGSVLGSPERLVCNDLEGAVGRNNVSKTLCWLNSKPIITDYNYYLSNATLPTDSKKHYGNTSGFGFSLTPGSNYSQFSSKFEVLRPLMPQAQVLSNIEQQANIDISLTGESIIISTPGYVDLPGNVTVTGDLIILAGGDLHIGTLTAQKSPIQVQLISASGVVALDHVDETISLRAESPIGVFLPNGIRYSDGAFLKRIEVLALGFN